MEPTNKTARVAGALYLSMGLDQRREAGAAAVRHSGSAMRAYFPPECA
jgi:hypothetical protein